MLVLTGVTIGLPVALALSRLVSSFLFGLKPSDPVTISVAALLIVYVSAVAGYLPVGGVSQCRSDGGAEIRVRQWLVASGEWLVRDARAEVTSEPLVTGRSAQITYH